MPESERVAPYVLLPQRLCIDLRDNPVALGAYALIARLFLLTHQPIPLSAGDLERFDQQTSYGQARRALARLCETGWVQVTALGRKNSYLPTWGFISGAARPWCYAAEKFGRPPHVRTHRISALLLDQIAYLTPHAQLPAVVTSRGQPLSIALLGCQILETIGLRPSRGQHTQIPAEASVVSTKPIDQLIPQSIDKIACDKAVNSAPECSMVTQADQLSSIPWESWDMNLTNQQAIPYDTCDRMSTAAQPVQSMQATRYSEQPPQQQHPQAQVQKLTEPQDKELLVAVHPAVHAGHRMLNDGRIILPGEWHELHLLEQQHGSECLLVWQARAQRRQTSIGRITPAYYEACAARAQIESWNGKRSAHSDQVLPAGGPQRDEAVDVSVPHVRAMPTGQLAEQLRSLGIRVLVGLGALDQQLVDAWVQASKHPDWARIWDDPAGAARALLLRGESPPTPEMIARRAARIQAAGPANWAAVVAASGGLARLGDDLSDLGIMPGLAVSELANTPNHMVRPDLMLPSHSSIGNTPADDSSEQDHLHTAVHSTALPTSDTNELGEQIRMILRLHATTRPTFQAVERLSVDCSDTALLIQPGRTDDMPILRNLLPVLSRVAAGRQIVLRS